MDIQTRTENNGIVITVSGRLDTITATDYEKKNSGVNRQWKYLFSRRL